MSLTKDDIGKMDDETLIKHITETKFLKDITKQKHLQNLKIIQTKIYPSSLRTILLNPKRFEKKLREYIDKSEGQVYKKINISTINNYYAAIHALFKYNQYLKEKDHLLYKKWVKQQSKYRKLLEDKYKQNAPTERQEKGFIPFDEIIKIRDKLKPGSIEKLLIHMYTDIAPLRADFGQVKIYYNTVPKNNKYKNFLKLNKGITKGELTIGSYKTAEVYGKIQIDLPKSILDELKLSLKKEPRDFLFVQPTNNNPFKDNDAFSKWSNRKLKRVFNNKHFSLTMFRHVYISRVDLSLKGKRDLEKDKIAKQMAHSISQQDKYSWYHWVVDNLENNSEN